MADITPGGLLAVKHAWPASPNYWNNTQQGFYNQDTYLTINEEPAGKSYYFWAQQFWFINGDGGYFGLQTGANMNGTEMKIAIFSVWKALDARPGNVDGAWAGTFGGEGTGYSCKIPFDWQINTQYRLRIWEIADARNPQDSEWWGAWVMNMNTREEKFIGQILLPADWKWLTSNSNFFVEYYNSLAGCEMIPYTKATLHRPTRENGTVVPVQDPTLEAYGICASKAKATAQAIGEVILETGK